VARLLSEETKAAIQAAIGRYPEKRSASIAALRAAQYQLGWLSPEVVAEVGEEMDLDSNGLYQLVTFYDMFYDHPVGTFVLGVCNNLSCYLRGADSLYEHLQKKLGIGPDETTEDGVFTLRTVECLAACGNAPAMMVNEDYYENLTPEKLDEMLVELRRQARLAATAGKKIGQPEVESLRGDGRGELPLPLGEARRGDQLASRGEGGTLKGEDEQL
jgi:NADH-quinone oxidoreductase subunit E